MSGRPDTHTVLEALLTHGADVQATCEPERESALHLALKHSPGDVAELLALRLLQNGADTELRDRSLRSPYDYALARGYLQVVRVLGENLPVTEALRELLDQRLDTDAQQLILAVQQGHMDDLRHCIVQGGSRVVNYIDPEGDTALNLVIKNEMLYDTGEMHNLIRVLLQNDAAIDVSDLDGKDALTLAGERGYRDVVDLLHHICPTKEALKARILNTQLEDFRTFLQETRIDRETLDEEGRTCVHWAVLREDPEDISPIINLLAEYGADINATSHKGETPLHLAAERGTVSAVKTLLSLGAFDLCTDDEGRTAEVRGAENDHVHVVKVLTLHRQKGRSAVYANVKESYETESTDSEGGAAHVEGEGEYEQVEGEGGAGEVEGGAGQVSEGGVGQVAEGQAAQMSEGGATQKDNPVQNLENGKGKRKKSNKSSTCVMS